MIIMGTRPVARPRRIDAHPAPGLTVRFVPDFPDEVDLYAGGWCVGSYKTARGLQSAIARHTIRRYWVNLGTVTYGAVYRADGVLVEHDSAEVAVAFPTFRDLMEAARKQGGTVIDVTTPGKPHTLTKGSSR